LTSRKLVTAVQSGVLASVLAVVQLVGLGLMLHPQTADQAWLKFSRLQENLPVTMVVKPLGKGDLERSAADELRADLLGLYGALYQPNSSAINETIVVGTLREVQHAYPDIPAQRNLGPDGYWLYCTQLEGRDVLIVAGGDERGALYGVYALLRRLTTGLKISSLNEQSSPAMPIRWVDEWDNFDGTIERGYAGRSIFFEGGQVRADLAPVREYARLLASVGINAVNVNNVNNSASILDEKMIAGLARVAAVMRPYGVRLAVSVDIASPQMIGGLKTFDPLDPAVQKFWNAKVNAIYSAVPDFAGFTVKADSEGQPGPASYGRTPADAANMLAEALRPHGGIVLYRAFVYDHHLDWRDPKADRARAAYDIFHELDGKFASNVVVQIKEGPIDFQVREPISTLFTGLHRTASAMELQITQEYTGQQRHMVYLAPMWKWVLDFDLHASREAQTPVKRIVTGTAFHQPLGGIVGVAGIGRDGWLGSPMALANLYAFGRLAWDPELDPALIAHEWALQTFTPGQNGHFGQAEENIVVDLLMRSWPAYENYTGPLGLQTLTDITGSHYGPNIESSERNGWGQWHNADSNGIGKDRTAATGSGYAAQYPPFLAGLYESPKTTPDNLVLFFHHLPYTWRLHSGNTIIQTIYDTHYDGAQEASRFVGEWKKLEGHIDSSLYADVFSRFEYQAGHAIVWRDAIVQYFLKLSGIDDDKGRTEKFPGRMEAEEGRLMGYSVVNVKPWEDASRGRAVVCNNSSSCSVEWTYAGAAGRYDLAVEYFDLSRGAAKYIVAVNGRELASWTANASLPSRSLHGDNSTRKVIHFVDLRPGEVIHIQGMPDGNDKAAIDYIEIVPSRGAPQ
jgi:alpha-glucuronidase